MNSNTMQELLTSLRFMSEFPEHEKRVYQILDEEFPYTDFSKSIEKLKNTQQYSIACVAWVFRCLNEILQHGGTFRHLIYDIMQFGIAAYEPLYKAGGMNITNALNSAQNIDNVSDITQY